MTEEVILDYIITENNLYLNGEITPDNSKEIVEYIITANFPLVGDVKLEYINLFVNSPGGCLDSTFSIIGAIRASSIPVRTIALGACASGGLMICISGAKRYVDRYTSIMSHTLSTGYPEFAKPAELQNWLTSVHIHKQKLVDLYLENTFLTENVIVDKLLPDSMDMYLTPKQSIEFGLFDEYFDSFSSIGGIK